VNNVLLLAALIVVTPLPMGAWFAIWMYFLRGGA
jgi:hypothetical protein